MTCAKRVVIATLTNRHNPEDYYIATNNCSNPQQVCPREDGEDYTKCHTVCKQAGHAETSVLNLVRSKDLTDYDLTVIGHDRMCQDCMNAVADAGVLVIKFKPEHHNDE